MQKVAQWYACTGATDFQGRCRNQATSGGRCVEHPDALRAPEPQVVLLKFNVNSQRGQELEVAGIPRKAADWLSREEKHVEHARDNRREAYRFRDVADSGVPVFGKQGAMAVQVLPAWQELSVAGFHLRDIHLVSRRDGKMDILVMSLAKERESAAPSSLAAQLVTNILASSWEFVHVWANPPQKDGAVVHTVNCVNRQPDQKRPNLLQFQDGLWGVSAP